MQPGSMLRSAGPATSAHSTLTPTPTPGPLAGPGGGLLRLTMRQVQLGCVATALVHTVRPERNASPGTGGPLEERACRARGDAASPSQWPWTAGRVEHPPAETPGCGRVPRAQVVAPAGRPGRQSAAVRARVAGRGPVRPTPAPRLGREGGDDRGLHGQAGSVRGGICVGAHERGLRAIKGEGLRHAGVPLGHDDQHGRREWRQRKVRRRVGVLHARTRAEESHWGAGRRRCAAAREPGLGGCW